TGCLAMSPLDVAEPDARSPLDDLKDRNSRLLALGFATGHSIPIASAVLSICRTPRTLKQALRATYETWCILTGEIDFDDLMVANILRYAEPDAFAALQAHVIHLRGESYRSNGRFEREHPFARALRRLPSRIRLAVESIAQFLFPAPSSR